MLYATLQDLLDRESEDLVYAVFDRDHDGVLDTVAVDRCIADASGEMDGSISQRFTLPLPQPPTWGVQTCLDIAIYRGAREAGALTKEIRLRYDDAQVLLDRVAKGKLGLGYTITESTPGDSGDVKGGEILVQSNERAFTRSKLRGW